MTNIKNALKKVLEGILFIFAVILVYLVINYFTVNYLGVMIVPKFIYILPKIKEGYEVSGVLTQVYSYEGSCYGNADYKLMVGENLAYYLKDSKGILKGCIGKNIVLKISYNPVGKCHNTIAEANIYEVVSLNSPCINV